MRKIKCKDRTLFIILFHLTIFLVGCWDREEVNDIVLVMATGIDYHNDEEIELSIEAIIPGRLQSGSSGSSTEQVTFVQSATGKTTAEAISALQMKFSRRLFWGHNRAVVFNEELVRKKGIKEELEYFSRFPEARLRDKVFVTSEKAKDLLTGVTHLENSTAESLREISSFKFALDVSVHDILLTIKKPTEEASVPVINVSKDTSGAAENRIQVELTGTALFKGEKMIDMINITNTRGLLWFLNEIKLATVTIKHEETDGYLSTLMIKARNELIPEIKDGTWKVTVKSESEDDVIQNTTGLDLTVPENFYPIKKQLEDSIEQHLEETAQKIQKEIKVDVLGIGRAFRKKYPKEWAKHKEDWNEFFTNIEIDYDVTVYIRRLGLSTGEKK